METVDAAGSVGSHTSLALDAQGNPHISYLYIGTGDLKYAAGAVGQYTSLEVDTGVVAS